MKTIQWLSNKIGVQTDKILHFLISFIISFPLMFTNIVFAIGITLLAGAYKEFTDMHKKENYWSWYDLLADCLGIILSLIIYLLL